MYWHDLKLITDFPRQCSVTAAAAQASSCLNTSWLTSIREIGGHRLAFASSLSLSNDLFFHRFVDVLGLEIYFFDFCVGTRYEVLAPRRNRERGTGGPTGDFECGVHGALTIQQACEAMTSQAGE